MALSLSTVFDSIAAGIKADPSLVKKVGGSYLFEVKSGGDTKKWLVNLKTAPGGVTEGGDSGDCKITLAEEDFISMVEGKLSGQQAFMQGKLRIAGNMGLAMKLEQVFKAAKSAATAAPAPAAAPAAAGAITAAVVFREIKKNIASDPSMIQKVGGTYLFKLGDKSWTVDLKNAPGSVSEGGSSADCTITMAEQDFIDLMLGKMNGQQAFMQGKLRISGNMGLAMKLQVLSAKKSKL